MNHREKMFILCFRLPCRLNRVLDKIDLAFTAIFGVEVMLKVGWKVGRGANIFNLVFLFVAFHRFQLHIFALIFVKSMRTIFFNL